MTSTAPRPGPAVEVRGLTKRFGTLTAVDDLTFVVSPGRITGFLGPNGAGKTTTLRMLLGLVHPTSGTATIDGVPYRELPDPLSAVGAALEATNFHPGRSGRNHLRVLAATAGISDARVDELLELTGIAEHAARRAGAYSLGMRQRLALAAALLGDPRVLLLDEPANGLDPEGIRWLRGFLRHLVERGKTVVISSHLLQEMQQIADDIVIIANGRLVRQGTMAELAGGGGTVVRTSEPDRLRAALATAGIPASALDDDSGGALLAQTHDLRLIGDTALAADLPIWELREERADLEALFFSLTAAGDRDPGGFGGEPR